ncbi:LysE family transporter [Nocardioides sp. TF02-7]|uniref:LysE family translocator n=1 Tax=Nocardioides sp. TF02-7 TaxID=2917724 RepID=UPI0023DA126F|nr:LysE family transporter [Nocardioides sp. TF02-7]
MVGATNPKSIVFFLAFLPQFVNEGAGPAGVQIAALGMAFGVMAIGSDAVWTLAASKARAWFSRKPRRLDALGAAGGAMMVGLGTTMAVAE